MESKGLLTLSLLSISPHGCYHSLDILIGQIVMHREADYLVGYAVSDGEVVWSGRGEASVCGEFGYERIEVTASEDICFLHLEIKLIARHTELFCINEDREV